MPATSPLNKPSFGGSPKDDPPRPEYCQRPLQSKVKHGAYAYFPGTGPSGKTCAGCEHFKNAQRTLKRGTCMEYMRLTGSSDAGEIRASASACKYWADRFMETSHSEQSEGANEC